MGSDHWPERAMNKIPGYSPPGMCTFLLHSAVNGECSPQNSNKMGIYSRAKSCGQLLGEG
jgi:hypothetical protein